MCIDPADKPCIYTIIRMDVQKFVYIFFLALPRQRRYQIYNEDLPERCRRYWVPSITTQARIHSLMDFHGTRYLALSLSGKNVRSSILKLLCHLLVLKRELTTFANGIVGTPQIETD